MFKKKSNVSGRPVSPVADKLDFVVSEAYNLLRTNLMLSIPDDGHARMIGMTSATPQDGKSYTSVNLAYALAKDGHNTLLVSSDLRKPGIEKNIGFENKDKHLGLADILAGITDFDSTVMKNVLHENMSVLLAGTIPPMPSELLGSKRFTDLLESLKTRYDYVIFDLPPVLSVVDPVVVGRAMDGMIIVVRHMVSRKSFIVKTVNQLRYANIHIVGFVYNANETSGGKKYYNNGKYYKDYYKSYYTEDNEKEENK